MMTPKVELGLVIVVVSGINSSLGCQAKVGNLGSQVGIQKDVAALQALVDVGRVGEVIEITESICNVMDNLYSPPNFF
ncbi:hypothetical protein TorRG33x02_005250 [Trema orientale]|uniref:Uncharacterized protein n=1 Tax=Trema orientale TaxID=63057 RepID=A0A2P5FZT8_TREOI|nr:hypothetical protein TorRG33x02_005250 [Trema orientale]